MKRSEADRALLEHAAFVESLDPPTRAGVVHTPEQVRALRLARVALTQNEVAIEFKKSRGWVSQHERSALKKIRAVLSPDFVT